MKTVVLADFNKYPQARIYEQLTFMSVSIVIGPSSTSPLYVIIFTCFLVVLKY